MFRLGVVFMAFKIDGQFVYNIFVLRKTIFIYLVLKFNTYNYLFNNKCFYIKKESWQTFEETSGYVRPERVNKWPNSVIDIRW